MGQPSKLLQATLQRCAWLEHRLAAARMGKWLLHLRLLRAGRRIEQLERALPRMGEKNRSPESTDDQEMR